MDNELIKAKKCSLKDTLISVYNLTEEEANSVIDKIDFAYPFVIEYASEEERFRYYTTLEYVKENLFISPFKVLDFKDPTFSLDGNVEVATKEKQEEIYIVKDQIVALKPGKINIINDKKELIARPIFDKEKPYVAVKKITHKINAVNEKQYIEYSVLIYKPTKSLFSMYIKSIKSLNC